MNSALLVVAIITAVILAAVIVVQRVKYNALVRQTDASIKDLQEKLSFHVFYSLFLASFCTKSRNFAYEVCAYETHFLP